ncbi:hypothetical protein E9993_16165 [Labilibacter sediminis]|nr:hypothetical protein E9993_16165 [Labilibacter sediminis]
MRIISERNFFEPRARLLIQLGDRLIKNENIALLELIKNSYDADASKVSIKFTHPTDKKKGIIDIIDDGIGMDIDVIENAWLEPGSDNKAKLFRKGERTEKYGRLPIGEKGIGRFGVHKLGNKIELVSKKKGGNEVVVRIDWNEFSISKYLKDARFEVFERTPEYFRGGRKGTRITISDLRNNWDRRMIRELYKSVFTLNSPFAKNGSFNVKIDLDNNNLFEGMPKWEDVKDYALFYFKSKIKGTEIIDFEYRFTPWDEMSKLNGRTVSFLDDFVQNRSTVCKSNKKEDPVNLEKNYGDSPEPKRIGPIEIEGYIFDRDKTLLELSKVQGRQLLKQYLDEQGGVRVYRDGLRINEYGEKGNDWLNLDSRRVNTPTKKLSNNIVLAVVELKGECSQALVEKTNREGFIENEAFYDFREVILYVLGLAESLRDADKDDIRRTYNPTDKQEPVTSRLSSLKGFVVKRVKDSVISAEIISQLDEIERDYNDIQEILLTSAGAGLTLSVGMHEVHKVLKELMVVVGFEETPDKIKDLVKHLSHLIKNYSEILKQTGEEEFSLKELLKGAEFNNEYRLFTHEIDLFRKYDLRGDLPKVSCAKRLLLGALTNIIDNSIYWLEKKYKREMKIDAVYKKKMFLDIVDNSDGYLDIIIADNGTGFDIPTSKVTKPFVSSKNGGMGLGLHIVNEIMKLMNGKLVLPDFGDYDLPEEFKQGAVVVLKLKK